MEGSSYQSSRNPARTCTMHTAVVTRSTEGYAAHTLLFSPINRGLCSMHTAAVIQTVVYAACTLLLSLINRGLCSTHNAVVTRTTEGYAAHTLLLSLEPQRIMQYAPYCCTRSTESYTAHTLLLSLDQQRVILTVRPTTVQRQKTGIFQIIFRQKPAITPRG